MTFTVGQIPGNALKRYDVPHVVGLPGTGTGVFWTRFTIRCRGCPSSRSCMSRGQCISPPKCCAQYFGGHLLRELTFIVDSNGFRWARLMKTLLREVCHRVNKSATRTLTEPECRSIIRRYRTILTQGGKELPDIPPRPKGQRGRIAKSDAHNLHERLARHRESVLRFVSDPNVSFTNDAGE